MDILFSGQVDIRELKTKFNAKAHPIVVEGRRTERQARDEFNETFDYNHPTDAGFNVSFDEFVEYYSNVSAVVESDVFFH